MADPLSRLRDSYMQGKLVEVGKDGLVYFGDVAYEKSARTNYVRKYGGGGGDNLGGEKKDYYTLECLIFFLKHVDTCRHPVYVKRAVEADVPIVNIADRKHLLDYMKGTTATADSVDRSAPIAMPVQHGKRSAAAAAVDLDENALVKKSRFLPEEDQQRERERRDALLDGTGTLAGAPTTQPLPNRDLSDKLTVERIAAIKSKMYARKRTTIKAVDEDEAGGLQNRVYVDSELDVVRDVFAKERQWRTRNTRLEAHVKQFAKTILPLLHNIKSRTSAEEQRRKSLGTAGSSAQKPLPGQHKQYNRYEQEVLLGRGDAEEFNIDTFGSFHGITLKSISEGNRQNVQDTPVERHRSSSRISSSSTPTGDRSPSTPKRRTPKTPIIIIPGTATSLITLYNARELLQDLKFVTTEDRKAQGARRENQVLVQRRRGDLTVPYQVIDNPLKLTAEEWERVVAVFVQGPAWQFKGWPWNGNPVDIFAHTAAFHLSYHDQKLDTNVAKWNVKVLSLNRNSRHLDRASMLVFWELLDRHIAKHKPHLRY